MIGGIVVRGASEVAAEFEAASNTVPKLTDAVVAAHGRMAAARVRAKASGRPGPNVITGAYRRSWHSRFYRAGGAAVSAVSSDAPQKNRLEYGFVGVDVLGREYHQPPFPHIGPAMDEIEPLFLAALEALPDRLLP